MGAEYRLRTLCVPEVRSSGICNTFLMVQGVEGQLHKAPGISGLMSAALVSYSLILSGIVTVTSSGENLAASFGPIDDHEPLSWLSSDGRLGFGAFWPTLIDRTEVGSWPEGSRFRPVYYLLRVGQAVAFGDEPLAWYLSVMVAFTVALTAAGLATAVLLDWVGRWQEPITRKLMLLVSASLGIGLFAGLDAWSGIVTRLGPAELAGLMFSVLGLLGILLLVRTGQRWWWWVVLPATTASALSKETFVLLPVAAFLTGAYLYVARGRKVIDALCVLVALAPLALLLPVVTGPSESTYVGDDAFTRVAPGLGFMFQVAPLYWIAGAGALICAFALWVLACGRLDWSASAYVLALILWSIALQFVDAIFYGGEYTHARYWAVFGLAKTLQVVGTLALSLAVVRRAQGVLFWSALGILVIGVMLTVRLLAAALQEYGEIQTEAAVNSMTSQQFSSDINALVETLSENPGSDLVVVVPASTEYEPAVAILQEVQRRSQSDILSYLLPALNEVDVESELGSLIIDASQLGSKEWKLSPWLERDDQATAVCAFINRYPFSLYPCSFELAHVVRARGM